MLTTATPLGLIGEHYRGECRELFHIVLNSTSATEANIALEVLSGSVPERTLVAACNLREVLAELPATPFAMRVDEDTLAGAAGLTRHMAVLERVLDDGTVLAVTTAGNLVLDILVAHRGERHYWNPVPIDTDRVTASVLDAVVDSPDLLDSVIELITAMGMVFNPTFYLSLEDWKLEYAADVFEGIGELF